MQAQYKHNLVSPKYTNRINYLNFMSITDCALEREGALSINWVETGEYIAANRDIVNKKFRDNVSKGLVINKNYLSLESADECLNHVD